MRAFKWSRAAKAPPPAPPAPPLPIPPLEMREMVGPTEVEAFDNPTGEPIFAGLIDDDRYTAVFDFGCGCGRLARRLIQQRPQPVDYVGTDLHAGMVRWCAEHLTPAAPQFRFVHHPVYNAGFNPDPALPATAPLPADDASRTLCIAWSVFTHTTQQQTEHYLAEVARILQPGGVLLSTWFLFDKRLFPMMQDFQQTLYINDVDPTNATIHDADWVIALAASVGLTLRAAQPPGVRGFAWILQFTPTEPGVPAVELPADDAPLGRKPPPLVRANADRIGLDEPR
jgi:SAM-dependent methyltransferase